MANACAPHFSECVISRCNGAHISDNQRRTTYNHQRRIALRHRWCVVFSGVLLSLPRHNEINPTAICSFLWFIIRLSGVLLLKPVYVITDSLFKYMVYCIVYCLWFMIIVVYGLYVCLISVVEWARMSMWCFCRSIIGSLFLILDGVIGWIIYITLVAVSSMILRGRSATATRIARHLVTKSFARK